MIIMVKNYSSFYWHNSFYACASHSLSLSLCVRARAIASRQNFRHNFFGIFIWRFWFFGKMQNSVQFLIQWYTFEAAAAATATKRINTLCDTHNNVFFCHNFLQAKPCYWCWEQCTICDAFKGILCIESTM